MKTSRLAALLFAFILSSSAFAKVQVAFFVYRTKDGQIHPLEAGGLLYHVAIQYGDHWMHAHPYYGVQVVSDVNKIGSLYSIIEVDQDVPDEAYQAQMGRSFSMKSSWNDQEFTYCSKLVAQILGLRPTPMEHAAEMGLPAGLGLSPDDIYKILQARVHREVRLCSGVL